MADALGNKRYSSKIIKAGALLPDTKLLLETWDADTAVEDDQERVREENLLGKSSRSRVEDVLRFFRQRYLEDPEMLRALVALVKGGMPSESLDRVLYFQAARSDLLLHDLVAEVLAGWSTRSDREVRTWEVQNWVDEQVEAGNTERPPAGTCTRAIEREIVKAVSGFMNAHGGTFFIGVNDSHEAVGLDDNYKLTGARPGCDPRDSFENWLTGLMDTSIARPSPTCR